MENKIKNEGLVNNSNQRHNIKTPQTVEEFYWSLINTMEECESNWGDNTEDDSLYMEYMDSVQSVEDFLSEYEQLFIQHSVQY
jgi:hypothetical protein